MGADVLPQQDELGTYGLMCNGQRAFDDLFGVGNVSLYVFSIF
jgi:hypothetical protein